MILGALLPIYARIALRSSGLPAAAAALLGAAIPLQLLTLELALARGTNPDLIRREQAPWREAAALAGE